MTGWRFEWGRDWTTVWSPAFLSRWETLLAACPHANVYLQPSVVRAWADTHGRAIGAEPLFGIATGPDGASVLLTFIVTTQHGRLAARRSLSAAGEAFFGYHDPLVVAPAGAIDWPAFWEAVRLETAGDCDQALLRFVHAEYASGPLSEPGAEASPLLDISACRSLDDAFARCSKDHRHETRRLLRRLGDRGLVALQPVAPERTADAWANGFVPMYDAYWRSKPTGSMFDRAGVRDFATRVIDEGTRDGWTEFGGMHVGAHPVAWYVGLIRGDSFYLWITTYDAAYYEFSPGRLLLALLIERCIGRGMARIHLMTGDQHYKREWRPVAQDMRTVRWHAPTAKGRLLGWYDGRQRTSSVEAS
jgi:CelD/BcsL family acetyltransferase involved in cellulose biosynthesis